ncbi:MAG TPA: tetratricopeptide repeat protein [Candidatus Binatia bacterium]
MERARSSELVDTAESLRRRGRVDDALEAVEQVLAAAPEHRRALLLKSRLLYQRGALGRALDVARALEPLLGGEAAELTAALMRLDQAARRPAPFATESMARLLTQQGYFLEAIEVYKQLYEASANPGVLDEIVRLTGLVEREGSRDAGEELVRHGLEVSARWLEKHPKGS